MIGEHVSGIIVSAWGTDVGALAVSARPGRHRFQYVDEWVAGGIELAPLVTPLSHGVSVTVSTGPGDPFRGLPPFIADSLPDRFGEGVLDAYARSRGLDPRDITPLDRLAYVGTRGLGALTYRPAFDADIGRSSIHEVLVAARASADGDAGKDVADVLPYLLAVGGSAGGAQAKVLVDFDPLADDVALPSPSPSVGSVPAILKIAGGGSPPARVELAYAHMARSAGIDVPVSAVVEVADQEHFVSVRFDVTADGDRFHAQTLAAVAGLDFNAVSGHDYDQYLRVLQQLGIENSAGQAFRRLAFNVIAAVTDDHVKNLGFLCNQKGLWRLAPAYDLVPAAPGRSATRHASSVLGRFDRIDLDTLLAFAHSHQVPDPEAAIAEVQAAITDWRAHADAAGVREPEQSAVAKVLALAALPSPRTPTQPAAPGHVDATSSDAAARQPPGRRG